MIYVADFETSWEKDLSKTWVWAACVMDIYTLSYKLTNNIEDFIKYVGSLGVKGDKIIIYFHNLKFDGSFIMDSVIKAGKFKRNDSAAFCAKVKLKKNEYCEMIDGMGRWYRVKFKINGRTIEFRDSAKLLPMSVAEIADAMHLTVTKGEIDYKLYRPLPYDITDEEEDYIKRDCEIVARGIKEIFIDNGYDKLTIGSNCMKEYLELYPRFTKVNVVTPEEDEFVRKSYRGGICWVGDRSKYSGKITIIDKNSMYPSVMHSSSGCLYPTGQGKKYSGDPAYNLPDERPLFVQHIRAVIEVKDNCIPFLQIETGKECRNFVEAGEIDVVLTKPDLELLFEMYNVYDIEYLEGIAYRVAFKPFDKYINKWYAIKEKATIEKNYGMRLCAKLFLNNLYGKLATSPHGTLSLLNVENGVLKAEIHDIEKNSIYIPQGSFVTAYARQDLIRTAMKCGGREKVLYMDTDSVHFIGIELDESIPCHPSKLGHWDIEGTADSGIYIRQKTYAERTGWETDSCERDKWTVKACGCSKSAKKNILDVENEFKIGMKVNGKLIPKKVAGGVVLVDAGFQIKA